MPKPVSPQTAIIHSPYRAPEGFSAFPLPIHHASTVLFPNVAAMRAADWLDKGGYTYGLHGTPTTFALEAQLAQIEGGTHAMLTPSGLSAIALVDLALLKAGDDVLIPDNAYSPNRDLGKWLARDFGISARFYDPLLGAGIGQLIQPNTRLVWAEAPGSVTMEVPDIPTICHAAHARGVPVALDNTWSAGLAFRPFEHEVDISMQALTKYQSGGSDVLMGAVIVRDKALSDRLELARMRLGYGVGADDVYLVSRGLQSLKVRFDAQAAAGHQVAQWLATRPEVATLLHPAFPSCPGHDNWRRTFSGAAGLFSIILDARYSEAQVDRLVDSLELFKIGYSWGGSHSLCVPLRVAPMRKEWHAEGVLLRFSIGLEDVGDLIADLEQAFGALAG